MLRPGKLSVCVRNAAVPAGCRDVSLLSHREQK